MKVVDAISGEPLPNVIIKAGVGIYASTKIGRTHLDSLAQASFNGPGPVFENGYLELNKVGYLSHVEFLSLGVNESVDLGTLKLYRKQQKNFTLTVLDMEAQYSEEGYLLGYNITPRPISENESVFFTLQRIPFGEDRSNFNQVLSFTNEDPQMGEIVPGRYTLTASLIDNEGIIIPKYTKKICSDKESCKDIPEDKTIWQKIEQKADCKKQWNTCLEGKS